MNVGIVKTDKLFIYPEVLAGLVDLALAENRRQTHPSNRGSSPGTRIARVSSTGSAAPASPNERAAPLAVIMSDDEVIE
jgi:hypothetical protein